MTAKLAFSSSACPEWSLYKIATNARLFGFAGVEIRTHADNRHFSPHACSREAALLGRVFRRTGVSIFALSSCYRLDAADGGEPLPPRLLHLIHLARDMEAPYLRLRLPKVEGADVQTLLNALTPKLREAAGYAQSQGVSLALESSGAWAGEKKLVQLAERLDPLPGARILLNVRSVCLRNPRKWKRVCREVIRQTGYVRVSDGYRTDAHSTPFAPIGCGEVPVKSAIQLLRSEGFNGYINFEWDRIGHPVLEKPEVALPRFTHAIWRYWRLRRKHAVLV